MDSSKPGIQYSDSTDPHRHEDDMTVPPDADNDPSNGVQIPCQLTGHGSLNQPDGVRHEVQVKPNASDTPEKKRVQLWMAAGQSEGSQHISDAYWKIYLPDGSLDTRVNGTRSQATDCARFGNSSTAGTMLDAAYETGQLRAGAIDDATSGLRLQCQKETEAIYSSEFQVSNVQPCGEYKVEAHILRPDSEKMLVSYVDVICVVYLQIDFTRVDWGKVVPGVTATVTGDLVWDEAPSDTPTVRNAGNSGMGLELRFSAMTEGDEKDGVRHQPSIDRFGACFGRVPGTLQCIDPIPALAIARFDKSRDQVLCSNGTGTLDLAVHPPVALPPGTYTGTLEIMARAVRGVCPNEVAPPPDR